MAALPLVLFTATRVAPDEPYIFVRVRVALADVAYRVDPASALLLAMLLLVVVRDERRSGPIRKRSSRHEGTQLGRTPHTRGDKHTQIREEKGPYFSAQDAQL